MTRPSTSVSRYRYNFSPQQFSLPSSSSQRRNSSRNNQINFNKNPASKSKRAHIYPPGVEPPFDQTSSKKNNNSTKGNVESRTSMSQYDACLDDFLKLSTDNSVSSAIEIFFKAKFIARNVFFWENIPNLSALYSRSSKYTVPHLTGIVGYSCFSQNIVATNRPQNHPSYHNQIDSKFCPVNAPIMVFPLFDSQNNVFGIVQAVRPINADEFSTDDQEFARWFQNKFALLSNWLLREPDISACTSRILASANEKDFLIKCRKTIAGKFGSKSFEIWEYNKDKNEMFRYTSTKLGVNPKSSGLVGTVFSTGKILNTMNSEVEQNFNASVDGVENSAVVAVPYEYDRHTMYAMVLRSPFDSEIYDNDCEKFLLKIAPIVVLGLRNSIHTTSLETEIANSHTERLGLQTILEVARDLSSCLDVNKVSETIIEKGRLLTGSDRCSLFLLNDNKDRVYSAHMTAVERQFEVHAGRGVVGRTIREGVPIFVEDAYKCEFFDRSFDQSTGYKTKNILSVPIFNSTQECIGVTQMVNKKDGMFTEVDANVIKLFNTFCGIAIQNAKYYKESQGVTAKLKHYVEAAFSLTKSENVQSLLEDILSNARTTIGCQRASLFIIDESGNNLRSVIFDGFSEPVTVPLSSGFVGYCCTTKESIVANHPYQDPRFNKKIDIAVGFHTENLIAVPLISDDDKVIGAVELVNKTPLFNRSDLQLTQAFASFATIVLQKNILKELANVNPDMSMDNLMNNNEKNQVKTPPTLRFECEKYEKLVSLELYVPMYKSDDLLKLMFYFFDILGVRSIFKITNELLYRFLFVVRLKYSSIPYRNWTHAVEATQFLIYELMTSGLVTRLEPIEKLAVLLSSICHNASHNLLDSTHKEKAHLPLAILLNGQSISEIYRTATALNILSEERTSVIHSLSPDDTTLLWQIIIEMNRGTDVNIHFKLLEDINQLIDSGDFDLGKREHRLYAMMLMLKCSDISNVCRSFKIAEKWCNSLNKEISRKSDSEKENSLNVSGSFDIDSIENARIQIGFYNFICIPLFATLAKIFPELEVTLSQIQSNLRMWVQKCSN